MATDYTSTGITNGEVGTDVAGDLLYYTVSNAAFATSSTTYENSGVAGSFVTKQSSADSRLEFDVSVGMCHNVAGSVGQTTMCLDNASNTSYAEGDDLWDTNVNYRMYQSAAATHFHWSMRWNYDVGQCVPGNLTSFSAGQTLYWRMFFKVDNASYAWYMYHSGSCMAVNYREIQRT
jgi:hypothetical protein